MIKKYIKPELKLLCFDENETIALSGASVTSRQEEVNERNTQSAMNIVENSYSITVENASELFN